MLVDLLLPNPPVSLASSYKIPGEIMGMCIFQHEQLLLHVVSVILPVAQRFTLRVYAILKVSFVKRNVRLFESVCGNAKYLRVCLCVIIIF